MSNSHLTRLERNHYARIHKWLATHQKKLGCCEFCGDKTRKTEWALKHGAIYEKRLDAFLELCASCHRKYDYTLAQKQKRSRARTGVRKPHLWRAITAYEHGSFLKSYSSLTDAAKELGVARNTISWNLHGRSKVVAGKYTFKYANQ